MFKDLSTSEAKGSKPSPKAGGEDEMRCPHSSREAERNKIGGKFFLPLPFVLFRPSTGWRCPPKLGRVFNLPSPPAQTLISSRSTPADKHKAKVKSGKFVVSPINT